MKPLGKTKIKWSAPFAYAIGLIVTDGSLSKDGRHVSFTSKDIELINHLQNGLDIRCHIGKKSSGSERKKKYHVVQIGDVLLYRFLLAIGLMPNKSKRIGTLKIPKRFFFDFLRGHFDGDGTFYSYWDPRWKSSFMFYTVFVSACRAHIDWLQREICSHLDMQGHVTKSVNDSVYCLKYAKTESVRLLRKMYYSDDIICLSRKRRKIEHAIQVNNLSDARVEKLVNSPA